MSAGGIGTGQDLIRLIGLGGVGRHGVLPEERRDGQLFTVDVTMSLDTRAAAERDDLALTVDYAAVAAQVVQIIEGEPVNLVETLAARIADAVLGHRAVTHVEVVVHKPEAPVGVPFADVQVQISRSASQAGSVAAPEPSVAEPVAAPVAAVAPPVMPATPPPAAVPGSDQDEGVPALDGEDAANEAAAEVDLDAAPPAPVQVVLALGGNVGDVRATLRRAIDDLTASELLDVVGVAPLAKTAAVLQPDAVTQPDFLNTVLLARTSASPRDVLALVHEIEAAHGRTRTQRWGERTLDIDVITYDSVSTSDPELSLPHPRANERAFVLVPWAHLEPDAFLPGLGGGPVAALAETAPDRDGVRWLALDWYEPQQASASPSSTPSAAAEDVSTSGVHTGGPAPEPAAEVVDEASLEPTPAAAPLPELVPGVEPQPGLAEASFVPEPGPEPEPEPETGPKPAPEVQPEPVEPAVAPQPPVVDPEPTVEPAPEPAVEPAPERAVAPEPAPQPVAEDASEGAGRSADPWDENAASTTRIRPRWEPLRRDGGDGQ